MTRTAPDGAPDSITLESDRWRATLRPRRGGRMTSLIYMPTGREILLQPQLTRATKPSYGADFAAHDPSGFDECFPTVAPSGIGVNGSGDVVALPDHGEVWSRPWRFELDENALSLSISGVRMDYQFEKRVVLENTGVQIRYRLRNTGAQPLASLWSAHPLLRVNGGDRILLPPEVDEVVLEWASDPAVGTAGEARPWPCISRREPARNYATVQPRSLNQAVKCFTPKLRQGIAGIEYSQTGERLMLRFDPNDTPFLGIWLCYGGWPSERFGHHTIALEPTNGCADALHEAAARGACPILTRGEEKIWTLNITMETQ